MSLSGTFSTMALPDLLQWLSNAGKTGTLEVERDKVVKQIVFRDGRVIACASDDPSQLLGHYLISRGKVSEEILRKALADQGITKRHLGEILVEMGALSREDLGEHLADKAEETIFSLFDWDDASFRLLDSVLPQHALFPVDLRVDEILLRGAHRMDEMQRIRAVFDDPGIVLRHTDKVPSQDLLKNRVARRLYDFVNGERSLAEILLLAHASEYLVFKFLFELFRAGLVRIESVVRVEDEFDFPLDEASEIARPAPQPGGGANLAAEGDADRAASATSAACAVAAPPAPAAVAPAGALDPRVEKARTLLSQGEYDAAIDILDGLYRAEPSHESLRKLLAEAEAAFVDKAYKHYLPASKIPRLQRSLDTLTGEPLSPAEMFLLSRIDGAWDVKSIIQVSPLREVEALRAMKKMREKGLIDLVDPG
jgi:hypothetical protein